MIPMLTMQVEHVFQHVLMEHLLIPSLDHAEIHVLTPTTLLILLKDVNKIVQLVHLLTF